MMSHNQISLAGESSNRAGTITLPTTKLGGFSTVSDANYFGLDGAGNPKAIQITTSIDIVASSQGFPSSYSGTFPTLAAGSRMEWRRSSSAEYVNTSYAEFSYSGAPGYVVLGNQITLQAGNYLTHVAWPADTSSASNELHLRLKNETDSTYVGPHHMLGGGRSPNAMNAYVSISSAKLFSWQVTSVSGSWQTGLAAAHHGFSLFIVRI